MSDLNKTTYLPEEMAEEIQGLKKYIGSGGGGTNLDEIAFGKMTEEELRENLTNPGITDPKYYEEIAEAILEFEETSSESPEQDPVLIEKTITEAGEYFASDDEADGYSKVIVDIETAGTQPQDDEKTVLFYDYDGTLLYSYTSEEFLALSEMPQNPSHQGLTAQGWNWSFSDAQTYVQKCGSLIVGQTYITDDGKTRIYVHLESPYLKPYLKFYISSGSVRINWGDGTSDQIVTTSPIYSGSSAWSVTNPVAHSYTKNGDYIISIEVLDGAIVLSGNAVSYAGSWILHGKDPSENGVYDTAIRKIELGANVTLGTSNTASDSARFRDLHRLETITIPNGFMTKTKSYDFAGCSNLKAIIIPSGVTVVDQYSFFSDEDLRVVSCPKSLQTIGESAFYKCDSLSIVTLNSTSIKVEAFFFCTALKVIVCSAQLTNVNLRAFTDSIIVQKDSNKTLIYFPTS